MNILFSGITGYLGSNIMSHLLKKYDITIIDKEYNIINSRKEFNCFFYFSNPNEIAFNKDSEQAAINMIKHFYSLIRILENIKIKHIVYASTVRVYDKNVNIYGNTHLYIENMLIQYANTKSIDVTIARFGNIFGGSIISMIKRSSLVPHVFIKNALENNKIKMLTDGTQYRDFTPIFLVHKYIELIINTKPKYIDICSGLNVQLIDIVKIIAKEFPKLKIEISNRKLDEDIVKYNSKFDITREEVENEIIEIIQKWKDYYGSNTK